VYLVGFIIRIIAGVLVQGGQRHTQIYKAKILKNLGYKKQ